MLPIPFLQALVSKNTTNKPPQQISAGNIVNLGFHIYRSHLKQYFQLSLIAHLWLLVPIYGYAKFCSIAGLMSRLAFYEIIGQPESIKVAKSKIKNQLGKFWFTGIFVTILPIIQTFIAYFVFAFLAIIIFGLTSTIINFRQFYGLGTIFPILLGLGYFLIFMIVYIALPLWFYSPLFLTDPILGIQSNSSFWRTIRQSQTLTSGSRKRLILIISLSFLITVPVILTTYFLFIIIVSMITLIQPDYLYSNSTDDSTLTGTLYLVFFSIINGVIYMPMWQAIKAAVYYDILCRDEGLDINLRDKINIRS